MQRRVNNPKEARIAIRVSADDQREIEQIAKKRGYSSPSAFLRAAIRNEIQGRAELTSIEDRIAGNFERLSRENFRFSRSQQAFFALLDALCKTVLTCMPEPPLDARPQAIAIAKDRYHRLIRSAGQAMSGDARATMQDLVNHDPER